MLGSGGAEVGLSGERRYLAVVSHLARCGFTLCSLVPPRYRLERSLPLVDLDLSHVLLSPLSGLNTLCCDPFEHQAMVKREMKDRKHVANDTSYALF